MLRIDRASKTYATGAFGGGKFAAVRDVTFDVAEGEVVALIGESGSGKSTIGKMILRLLRVDGGSISFDGVDISTLKGAELKRYYRHVQGVFQDPFSSFNPIFRADRVFAMVHKGFFPDVSAADWRARVGACLESVGLNPPDVLNKFAHQLSGGQLQRLLIARALLLDIKMLVADEIISMLDASTRVDVLNLLAGLKTRGLGVLFITHDLSLGHYISEKAVILRRGVVLEAGSTDKVFRNPQHAYTQMLLASVPQLHSRWEVLDESEKLAEASVEAAPGGLTGAPPGLGFEPGGAGGAGGDGSEGAGGRPGGGALWAVSRGTGGQVAETELEHDVARRRKKDAYIRSHEEVPALVEVEEDHFVAVSSGAH